MGEGQKGKQQDTGHMKMTMEKIGRGNVDYHRRRKVMEETTPGLFGKATRNHIFKKYLCKIIYIYIQIDSMCMCVGMAMLPKKSQIK